MTQLPDDADAATAVRAAHHALARAPARMLCATLDDLLVVADRPNVPGAGADHPNWSLGLPQPIDELDGASTAAAVSDDLDQAVRSGRTPS